MREDREEKNSVSSYSRFFFISIVSKVKLPIETENKKEREPKVRKKKEMKRKENATVICACTTILKILAGQFI